MNETDWWKTVFDDKYLDTQLGNLTAERTRREVDFIVSAIGLKPEDKILDLACGHGRHCIELARRGFFRVTGLDYSSLFITKAKQDAQSANVDIHFMRGDMRNLTFKNEFDVVLLLFTAFGYFDDATNNKVLRQIHEALKTNGYFFIDVASGEETRRLFQENGVKKKSTFKISRKLQGGSKLVYETGWFDPVTNVAHFRNEWNTKEGKKEYDYWLRVYTMSQYERMLADTGFEIKKTWGNYDGRPFGAQDTSRTLILSKAR